VNAKGKHRSRISRAALSSDGVCPPGLSPAWVTAIPALGDGVLPPGLSPTWVTAIPALGDGVLPPGLSPPWVTGIRHPISPYANLKCQWQRGERMDARVQWAIRKLDWGPSPTTGDVFGDQV